MRRLRSALVEAHAPRFSGSIWDWLEEHGTLPHSVRTSRISRHTAPWLIEPMEAISTRAKREQTILGPVQGGKSTILDGLGQWIPVNAPGLTWFSMQKKEAADEYAEQRLMPAIKANPGTARLLPANRSKVRKNEIVFAHMAIKVQSANKNNVQSKSVPWVLNDEVWLWPQIDLLEMLRKRITAVWNGTVVNVSQGSVEDDPLHEAFEAGEKHEWGFTCPKCQQWQIFSFGAERDEAGVVKKGGVKWDKEAKNENGDYIIADVVKSVYYECENEACDARWSDTLANRRMLADAGSYRSTNPNADPLRDSWRWPAMTVYWIPWSLLVKEWLIAVKEAKRGNFEPMRLFIQQRLAGFWKIKDEAPEVALLSFGYTKADFAAGELVENEVLRIMAADVQRDHFWVATRVFCADGSSRLIYEGKVLTIESVRELQSRFKVKPAAVLMDRQYSPVPGEVNRYCAVYGFTGMNGSGEAQFKHEMKIKGEGRKDVYRPFSKRRRFALADGGIVNYVHWSNERVKDELVQYRAGRRASWGYPDDVSADWKRHMRSEIKKDVVDKKTGGVIRRYVKIDRENHLWDCEAMIMAGAMMFGVVRAPENIGQEDAVDTPDSSETVSA